MNVNEKRFKPPVSRDLLNLKCLIKRRDWPCEAKTNIFVHDRLVYMTMTKGPFMGMQSKSGGSAVHYK